MKAKLPWSVSVCAIGEPLTVACVGSMLKALWTLSERR